MQGNDGHFHLDNPLGSGSGERQGERRERKRILNSVLKAVWRRNGWTGSLTTINMLPGVRNRTAAQRDRPCVIPR